MLLSDTDIRKALTSRDIIVTPLQDADIQPASIDVHLGSYILVMDPSIRFQPEGKPLWIRTPLLRGVPTYIDPGSFILAPLLNHITLSSKIAASIHGKSSLGRIGLSVHCTAGYIDPGWDGILTLEISNISKIPIPLFAGMKIAQLRFDLLLSPATRVYGDPTLGSRYQGASEAEGTKYYD